MQGWRMGVGIGKLFKLKRYFLKRDGLKPITISKESQRSFTDLYGVPSNLIYNGTFKAECRLFYG